MDPACPGSSVTVKLLISGWEGGRLLRLAIFIASDTTMAYSIVRYVIDISEAQVVTFIWI